MQPKNTLSLNDVDMARDMVLFDRMYIPALMLTWQGQRTSASHALAELAVHWRGFRARYDDFNPDDSYQDSDFDFIQLMIAEARDMVDQGEDLTEAARILGGVRSVFLRLRRRNSITYFLDYLTAMYEPVKTIHRAAQDQTPESLTIAHVDEMRVALPEALRMWKKVARTSFNSELFGFDQERETQLYACIALEEKALHQLQEILATIKTLANEARIIDTALQVRQGYDRVLRLFGDFEPYGGLTTLA